MDCGIPFCHTGTLLSGMASGCPLNNLIPEWNDLVYRGRWRDALDRLHLTNNFPEFTGRVCPAPCEGSCVLGINDPTSHDQEHRMCDYRQRVCGRLVVPNPQKNGPEESRRGWVWSSRARVPPRSSISAGHCVTVFERADRIGGLLMYGIPNMKFDKAIVQSTGRSDGPGGCASLLPARRSGVTIPATQLLTGVRRAGVVWRSDQAARSAGRRPQSHGVHFAMDFLPFRTKACWTATSRTAVHPGYGQDVVVIGGGDTGTDCVATPFVTAVKSGPI